MSKKEIIKKLEIEKRNIGKERDKLRDLLDELSMLEDSCDSAYRYLEDAIDALSELV